VLARYGDDLSWGEPQTWIYFVVVVSIASIGWLGVVATRTAAREHMP
jgi:hypothetical protein